MRHFTSYGPVDPDLHYHVPRTALVEKCVDQLVGVPDKGGHFFTIWASRQTGKTWLMRRAAEEIRARYGDRLIVAKLSAQGRLVKDDPPEAFQRAWPAMVHEALGIEPPGPADFNAWARQFARDRGLFDRPLLLFIDEFDSLPQPVIDRVISIFRTIFLAREAYHLHGLALIGVRAILGLESDRGSPFNIQRGLHVPNLTQDEVAEMFRQYQAESGQHVDDEVVARVYHVTRGQPGVVGWFGELLTEKYNRTAPGPITLREWEYVYGAACQIEPNNTVLNLLKKARQAPYREHVIDLFRKSNVPFSLDEDWCNYLYLNGVIDYEETSTPDGALQPVCRFSSPFIQLRLYNAFSREMDDPGLKVPLVDPRDDLTEAFASLDLPAVLARYRDYLRRLRQKGTSPWQGQAGHFHLYWWLREVTARQWLINPEFPTGNGKVDLHVRHKGRAGVIEVKSFTQRSDLPFQKAQAAGYARSRGLSAATLALFVPTDDEDLLAELSATESIEGVAVTTVARPGI